MPDIEKLKRLSKLIRYYIFSSTTEAVQRGRETMYGHDLTAYEKRNSSFE